MARKVDIHHHNYKGNHAKRKTGNWRARVEFDLGPCARCGKKGFERHHRDGNPMNNTPSNVEVLCRKCHMVDDGRLPRLRAARRAATLPAKECKVCGTPSKPLRNGRCHRCNEFFRRNGIEWSIEARYIGKRVERFCNNCKARVQKGWSKGRCPSCRLYFSAHGVERNPSSIKSKRALDASG